MMVVSATLPLPPGINASYKSGRGRFYGSDELHCFKEEAYYALKQRGTFDWILIHEMLYGKKKIPLSATINFYYPTLWKRDIDGGEKATIDAVFSYIGLNDNLIVEKWTRKLVDRDNPRCEITVAISEMPIVTPTIGKRLTA
jgi:Holliday junction resolvase RusA-like endonuclease